MTPQLSAVLADKCGVSQMLLNPVVNAGNGMPGDGKVEFQTFDRRFVHMLDILMIHLLHRVLTCPMEIIFWGR